MRRPVTRRLVAAVAAGVLPLTLAACGDDGSDQPSAQESAEEAASEALDDVVAETDDALGPMREAMKDQYSAIEVSAEHPDTLVQRYVYAQDVDPTTAKAALEKGRETLRTTAEKQVLPALEDGGVTDPKVRYVYANPDGDVLFDETFGLS